MPTGPKLKKKAGCPKKLKSTSGEENNTNTKRTEICDTFKVDTIGITYCINVVRLKHKTQNQSMAKITKLLKVWVNR